MKKPIKKPKAPEPMEVTTGFYMTYKELIDLILDYKKALFKIFHTDNDS